MAQTTCCLGRAATRGSEKTPTPFSDRHTRQCRRLAVVPAANCNRTRTPPRTRTRMPAWTVASRTSSTSTSRKYEYEDEDERWSAPPSLPPLHTQKRHRHQEHVLLVETPDSVPRAVASEKHDQRVEGGHRQHRIQSADPSNQPRPSTVSQRAVDRASSDDPQPRPPSPDPPPQLAIAAARTSRLPGGILASFVAPRNGSARRKRKGHVFCAFCAIGTRSLLA